MPSPARRPLRLLLALSCLAFLPGADSCMDLGDDDDDAPAPPPATPVVLASAPVGPAGGTVAVTAGAKAGVGITVPPGALAATETITITDVTGTGTLPAGICDFLIEPEGLAFAAPVSVTVKYSAAYAGDFSILAPMTQLNVVSRTARDDPEILVPVAADAGARTVTVQTTHLSRFAAILFSPMNHYRFLAQKRMLAVQVHEATVGSEDYVVAGTQAGAAPVAVGQGSLVDFWSSNDNLILVHSTDDDARNFLGTDDLVNGLAAEYTNIVVYQYKSGRPIAENGNWLYNEIKANAQPGFACDILGYSLGGIVARYAFEGSPDDAARRGLSNYDAAASTGPLSNEARNFLTMGSPHAGVVDEVIALLAGAAGISLTVVDAYLPGLTDNAQAGGTAQQLNAAYADDPAVRYFLIAGHSDDSALSPLLIPGPDDGLVSTASATGVPLLNAPEEARVFPGTGTPDPDYNHSSLHSKAVPNGIRDQIVTWVNLP